jgi:hypothetical protein
LVAEYLSQGNELEFLESSGELGEVASGIDAMPFGASLVISVVVLPALLGCDVEEDVLDGLKRVLGGAFVMRLDSWRAATPSLAVWAVPHDWPATLEPQIISAPRAASSVENAQHR